MKGVGGGETDKDVTMMTILLESLGKKVSQTHKCSYFIIPHSRKIEIKHSYLERETIKTHASIQSKRIRVKMELAIPLLVYTYANIL